jgi:pimeloyl-ACP methyl ester carboxylesterase
MIAALALLAAQIALNPCTIEGVPGPTRCGTHLVWENRETKRGRQIELSIIVLDALTNQRKPDPLFMLQGGPGDAPSFNARFYSRVFADIRQTRDLVLVDLRGTGKSRPLTCPELAQPDTNGVLGSDLLDISAVKACKSRLQRQTDLRQYTTEIAVDDLDEVRKGLGYQQINLYGTSYGTRMAQVYMRRHPSSLRTVTMKGIVPPSMASPETHARAGEDAWQTLVRRCQNDVQCAREFPTLDADFRALLKQFDQTPVLPLPNLTNGASKLKVSRGLFAEAFRFLLYSPESAAGAPKLVHEMVHATGSDVIENVLPARLMLGGERLAAGFFLSVSCTEDIPYLPRNVSLLAAGTFGGDYRLRQQIGACAVWPHGKVSDQHRKPTRSHIPTLILSGEFDPVTPPAGGNEVVRGLPHGVHVVIRNNGHPMGSAAQCIETMMSGLIAKASVDGLDYSCASEIPAVPFQR